MSTPSPDAPPIMSPTSPVDEVRAFRVALANARVLGLGASATSRYSLFVRSPEVFAAWLTVLGSGQIRTDVIGDAHVSVRDDLVEIHINRRDLPGVDESRTVTVRTVRWPDEVPA